MFVPKYKSFYAIPVKSTWESTYLLTLQGLVNTLFSHCTITRDNIPQIVSRIYSIFGFVTSDKKYKILLYSNGTKIPSLYLIKALEIELKKRESHENKTQLNLEKGLTNLLKSL